MKVDVHQIIIEPIVTEKTSGLMSDSVYVFRVLKEATKSQIKNALKTVFGVDASSVNTTKVRGKARQVGRHIGVTSSWKKAYVKLKKGQKIKELEVGA
jgi:large subunit ribosomal protein L23